MIRERAGWEARASGELREFEPGLLREVFDRLIAQAGEGCWSEEFDEDVSCFSAGLTRQVGTGITFDEFYLMADDVPYRNRLTVSAGWPMRSLCCEFCDDWYSACQFAEEDRDCEEAKRDFWIGAFEIDVTNPYERNWTHAMLCRYSTPASDKPTRELRPLPYRVLPWGAALNTASYVGVMLGMYFAATWPMRIRRRRRLRSSLCVRCAYPTSGLALCPECGTASV